MANTNAQTFYPGVTDQDQSWGTDVRKLDTSIPTLNSTTTCTFTTDTTAYPLTVDPLSNVSGGSGNDNRTNLGWAFNEDSASADAMGSTSTEKRVIPAGTWSFTVQLDYAATDNTDLSAPTISVEWSVYRVATGGGTRTLLFSAQSANQNCAALGAAGAMTHSTTSVQSQYDIDPGETIHVAMRVYSFASTALLFGAVTNTVVTVHLGTSAAVTNTVQVPSPGIRTDYVREYDATGDGVITKKREVTKSLTATGVGASTAMGGPLESKVLALSPYLYWRLEDSSKTQYSVIADSSGNARTGIYWTGCIDGDPAVVQNDDVSTELVRASNGVMYGGPTIMPSGGVKRTIVMWCYRGAVNANLGMTFTQRSAPLTGQTGAYCFWGGTGAYSARTVAFAPHGNASGTVGVWTDAIPPGPNGDGTGQWVWQAIVWDDTNQTAELFINGVSKGTVSSLGSPGASDQGDLILGTWGALSSSFYFGWDGSFDEFVVFDDDISADLPDLYEDMARTNTKRAEVAKTTDVVGEGEITHNKAITQPRTAIGTGEITFTRATQASKSFDVTGKGEVSRDELLIILIERVATGTGTITSTKATTASKTFDLVGEGVITEIHPVQAYRTFNLTGEGTATSASDIVLNDFDLIGTGEVTSTKAVVASKSFTLDGRGTATSFNDIMLTRTANGKGLITEIHPVQAFRTFDLVGEGDLMQAGDQSSITIPIDEVPTEGGGGTTIIKKNIIVLDD